ncbi:AAA family ATPase [Arthrobacter sp. NPDC058127]|uniref:AAA family ATPase n=1 Tax=Arthrobacter sp. NPDC058127 TaxID=3346351 RepID=UPI0036DFF18E
MASVQHLSMRVPWRDRAWDDRVCDSPLGNSSCTLLTNIGANRDDLYEQANAGATINTLDSNRLPCLSERAAFMSPNGYRTVKTHPYASNAALKGTLHPTPVDVPGYAFEAVPYRWLNRRTLYEELGANSVRGFNAEAETAADKALGWNGAAWVMDGENQQAVIREFFDPVAAGESLVFMYLKHSPFQEGEQTGRLLVGAALISQVMPPPMWAQSGKPPFSSSMWETIVTHSLRPDMADGILLPYQELVALMDAGTDVSAALAWAPEGRDIEFSYVTEHVSDDAAIQALTGLLSAARSCRNLGAALPDSAVAWVETQIERLWQMRGPTPGLAAVLGHLGVERPNVAARAVMAACGEEGDPWGLLASGFADRKSFSSALQRVVGPSVGLVWTGLDQEHKDALRLLSSLDLSQAQVKVLMEDDTAVSLTLEELLGNPYSASICTYGQEEHVPFTTVDRACFPPGHVSWETPLPEMARMGDNLDPRRIEALLIDVLESRAIQGDTLLPQAEALDLATSYELTRPPQLSGTVLKGLGLDRASLQEKQDAGEWSALLGIDLADGTPGLKCMRHDDISYVIREWVAAQRAKPDYGELENARELLDRSLDDNVAVPTSREVDETEERARAEKAAGLSQLFSSSLGVLIGPAGTGKTTLLRALVGLDGIARGSVILLAPTGKARVQLQTKVGRPAHTLASFLTHTGRWDGARYRVTDDPGTRVQADLVVIDEASMLTEEMLAATLDAVRDVKRLVLVGDPRQLPPIGPGRPFVDLVTELRPEEFSGAARVGAGYVELTVTRRQLPGGNDGVRHDLQLASWFGERFGGAAEETVWEDLRDRPSTPTLTYEPWGPRPAAAVLTDALERYLPGLANSEDSERGFALTYGGTESGQYLNWELGAGKHADAWQILSPTRSRAFGVTELNRHLKRTYRSQDLGFAKGYRAWNIPEPLGPEQITRGDKVMQTRNTRMRGWARDKAVEKLDFIANGEIGVAIGHLISAKKQPKKSLQLNVEFSSQPGVTYSYRPTSSDDPRLELAWAVTVHKSQGSEFGTTFLVLPARTNVSRELMYTALTRQRDHVVILHEGTLEELRELAHPWRSETSRRLTDLFAPPQPVTIELRGESRRFERKLMHVTTNGVAVASKNEVIVAGILDELVPGHWEYEKPFTGSDGRTVLPDFTITLPDGRTIYWEHAGMLDLPDYSRKWALKKQWYVDQGIAPHGASSGTTGVLMWTDDRMGADAQAWKSQAQAVFGTSIFTPIPSDPDSRRGRRAPRKVVPSGPGDKP